MRFLFWNLGRKRLETTIARLVVLHGIDVLVLAECSSDDADIVRELQRAGKDGFHPVETRSNLRVFAGPATGTLDLVLEGDRFTIRRLVLDDDVPILLAATHLPSKANWSARSVSFECVALSEALKRAEREVGHQRSVLVGDLNLNPYEEGLIGAMALHSVPTRMLAAGAERRVQGNLYPMFYNPMWNFFGDDTRGPPGTFFRGASEHVAEFWNMYDQVLVRPALLSRFDTSQLHILTDDGIRPFHTPQGRPSRTLSSDHFPIVFQLNPERQERHVDD